MPDAITANLSLPLMAAAQAQKHVTHNEALVGLDTLVQLAVLDKDLTAPPANPAEGDRYLIAGASPTGAWAGWGGRVVRYQDGAWRSFPPRPGWLAFVVDEADLYTYAGGAWASFRSTLTVLQNLTRLGIGTTADAGNPFAAKLNKALWTALTTGEGGSGDLRYTLNKQAAGNVLSLLFQSGFSGRAELGLTGDDDLRLKVSPDGGTWREALRVDRSTGAFTLPQGGVVGGAAAAQRTATFDNFGRITWRFDDNGYVAGPILNNYGVTATGQGADVLAVNLGAVGTKVAQAGLIRLVTTDSFTSAATASAKWQFFASLSGSTGVGLEVHPTHSTTPILRLTNDYTVATLPAAGQRGRMVHCSNARMVVAGGSIEAAGSGTGGLVYDTGSAWRLAGTAIAAAA
ncbi:Protein of unknown function [Methylobacterium sp. ap11]|uniref:DUF2793 domain-containing protein n=1 Tax=Methylobacterium sp. ap11 TaxID=1761799 RepID=UPI0008BBA30E|nr:DUF2793 domain-containing protein [Methylobacterium sp. ap11]SEO99797.1 Protein of unknown function [Methylobacterium sp. ap11]